jgi:hypothetical protein
VSRSLLVTLGCCLFAAVPAVIAQDGDETPWTAAFAAAVLVVATTLVGHAALGALRDSGDGDDEDDSPR